MNRRLALIIGALGLATLAQSGTAEANRFRFSGGGRVRVHGNVSVRGSYGGGVRVYSTPRWNVGGRVYVGNGGYYPRYRYHYYYYQPVPSYYGYYSTGYYPVEPSPAVATTVVAPVARPELPKFGLGLFAGGVSVEDEKESSDIGVLGRLRLTPGLLIEGELGKMSYENDLRVDRRLGASLVYEIGAYNKLAPYVLGGLGVQQADVGGSYSTTQDYAELGVGLRYAISPHFHVLFDIRAGSRSTVSESSGTPASAAISAPVVTSGSGGSHGASSARCNPRVAELAEGGAEARVRSIIASE